LPQTSSFGFDFDRNLRLNNKSLFYLFISAKENRNIPAVPFSEMKG
jgi:hypothetical protein